MVAINKEEAKIIRKRLPDVHIVRTMKQKSKRGRYYLEEGRQALRVLDEIRGNKIMKAGVENRVSEKTC